MIVSWSLSSRCRYGLVARVEEGGGGTPVMMVSPSLSTRCCRYGLVVAEGEGNEDGTPIMTVSLSRSRRCLMNGGLFA